MGALITISSVDDFHNSVKTSALVVVHFWAPWCEPCKYMDVVLEELAKLHPETTFLRVEAEEISAVTEQYNVSAVPCFVLIKVGAQVDRLEGADAAALTEKVDKLSNAAPVAGKQVQSQTPPGPSGVDSVEDRIKSLLDRHPVLVFMKGSPDAPQCGFSSSVVAALRECGVHFTHFDILKDDAVRQGVKTYSNWPTYPQLYVNGELVGGCDIIREMKDSGELKEVLAAARKVDDKDTDLTSRLKALINKQRVMLFMKGTPDAPRCKFSRQVVDMLSGVGCSYGHFDILSDDQVREGLKKFSDWPTYPQLYVDGDLLGGCDIIREMKDSGELKDVVANGESAAAPASVDPDKHLRHLISSHKVMLFMKGTPDAPRCGFSSKVVAAIQSTGTPFGHFDILSDDRVREGLKKFSDWPTYPQLYANGELVGGCDIVLELKESGELKAALE